MKGAGIVWVGLGLMISPVLVMNGARVLRLLFVALLYACWGGP